MKNKQEIIDSCDRISQEIRTLANLVRTEKLDMLETCLSCVNDILGDFTENKRETDLKVYFDDFFKGMKKITR